MHHARPRFATTLCLTIAWAACSPAHGQGSPGSGVWSARSFATSLDSIVPALLSEMLVPGAAVALIENGTVAWSQGYGYANADSRKPVTSSTVFNVGSISKTVAAWGLMHLVEETRLDLDAPVERYLTRWHLPSSNFDNSGVTLRRLLSHTAGLSLHGYPGWDPTHALPTLEASLSGVTNGAGDVRVEGAPGSGYSYSGGGYTLAQLLVEEVTKESFAAYVRRAVLRPLGMSVSDYTWSPAVVARAATPYNEFGEAIAGERFVEQAAAALQTTVDELARFAAAGIAAPVTATRHAVLRAETIRLMQSAQPASPDYGLGYELRTINDVRLAGHTGANAGWMSALATIPDRGAGIVILTNGTNGQYVAQFLDCIWRASLGALKPGTRCRRGAVPVLLSAWHSGGMPRLTARYKELKSDSLRYSSSAPHLHAVAYTFLGATPARVDAAIETFTLATTTFPNDVNGFVGLGAAFVTKGDTTRAVANFERVLQLDPKNEDAAARLKELRGKSSDTAPPPLGHGTWMRLAFINS